MREHQKSEFETMGSNLGRIGFFAELWEFLCCTKKWWMAPVLFVLLLFAVLLLLGPVAPFIYTLF
jgi:hypothetical protein